jgi:ribosome biogenesis GTPase A
MTKAKRQMQEDIKLIDLVIELADARIPASSRNPDIDELGKNKYRLILLNKADLADQKRTEEWSAHFREKGYAVVALDSRKTGGMKQITDVIMEACREKIERDRKRRTVRSVRWSLESRTWANPRLSIPTRAKPVPKPATSPASRKANNGSA